MNKSLSLFTIGALAIALLGAAPADAQKKKKKKKGDSRNEGISLVWSPTTDIADLDSINLTGMTSIKFQIEPLVDGRNETEKIGENIEDDEPKLVTTPDDVPAFVTENIVGVFESFGLQTTESGGDIIIEGELRRFFCEEESTYRGEVSMLWKVKNKSGEVVWEGLANGSAKRFGRSYKDENYFESLSDSLLDAVYGTIRQEAFRKAVTG